MARALLAAGSRVQADRTLECSPIMFPRYRQPALHLSGPQPSTASDLAARERV